MKGSGFLPEGKNQRAKEDATRSFKEDPIIAKSVSQGSILRSMAARETRVIDFRERERERFFEKGEGYGLHVSPPSLRR